ncbi:MAG TPA: alternative ribosome rescue aminoacyl-tRNA hydrolase ArfB [Gemmataceae bacterium]|jgi:ribosome-associated protein|nr:alternative ribosome rescue aminoacyl-tRNA hydrolase ArfB [Gemmataceae bacterium]
MLEVNSEIRIPEEEFHWSFARSGGPGGQNVNKVASKAILHWTITSTSLPEPVKQRFLAFQRKRITKEGEVVINSQRFRDQERNRLDCLEKLREMILQAAAIPKKRKPTKPSRGSRMNRLQEKRRRSGVKALRKTPSGE